MYYNPADEYPHSITVFTEQSTLNGMGGTKKQWLPLNVVRGFMDTPTTQRRLEAHQMNITLDRDLYVPYGIVLPANARYRFGNDTYIAAGKPEDQGGMKEVLCLPLKLV